MKFLFLFLMVINSLTVSAQTQTAKAGDLKLEPYVFENSKGEKIDAEFGRLTVPENRSKPNTRLIELAFVRFKSTSPNSGAPIVYLAGGPGGSGIASARDARFPVFMAMREFGDVIALEQRGVGLANPNLRCRESWDFPLDVPGEPENLSRIGLERVMACADYWKNQGVDLTGYNTNESADDIEDLRKALGAKKVSLWGISYGTHLALATIRRHGAKIERAILAGVEGPDDTYKLPGAAQQELVEIDRRVKADPTLSKLVPDFLALVKTVLDRLEKQPVTVEITEPRTKQKIKVAIGKYDLQLLTAQGLGDSQIIASLPLLYYAMSKGDFSILAQQLAGFRKSNIGSAMAFMMDCSSGVSEKQMAQIKREEKETLLGNAVNPGFPDVCVAFGNPDLGAAFRLPVKSKISVLFVSGTLDGRTPVSNAEAARKGFPRGIHLIVDGAAHGDDLFISTPQIKETMLKFMKNEKMPAVINTTTVPAFELRKPPAQKGG